MHSFITLATAFAVAAVALPSAHPPYTLHEKRESSHPAWVKRSEVPTGAKLPVRIGLSQSNLDKGHDLLMDISTHSSPNYGKHYSADEIIDLFAPAEDSVNAVSDWLRSAGIEHFTQSVNKQWLQVDLRVEELEDLLHTKYHEWEHTGSGDVHVACDE